MSTFGTAATGPMPMMAGSTPATAKPSIRAIRVAPVSSALALLMMIVAAAPSFICDELPAVTEPPTLNTGRSLASASRVEPGRGPSSIVCSFSMVLEERVASS